MGGIELYCDLLSMPDVLKPEHRSYVEELRLLDTRSEALIEHLTQLLSQEGADGLAENASSKAADMGSSFGAGARIAGVDAVGGLVSPAMPVSLQRPAAASTERMEIGNESGEVSTPDCHSCSVPSRLRAQQDMGGLIGSSPEMEKVYRILSKVAHSTHPVLILGESGTGKEMVARSIHNNGPNAAKPFIPVDCGSLVPTLIESELFGHVKGAFTGANRSKGGCFRPPTAAPSFWTRSASFRWICRPSCCAPCRRKRCARWGPPTRCRLRRGCWRRPTAT